MADTVMNRSNRRITDVMAELKKNGLKSEYKDLALPEFLETTKYPPQNWKARYFIATDYFSSKHYKEAILEYRRVIDLNPNDSDVHNLIGAAYMENGEYDLAIDSF